MPGQAAEEVTRSTGSSADTKNAVSSSKASWQAQVAFALSIYSTLFGAYQWWKNLMEDKVEQTMDISRSYLNNKDIYRQSDATLRWENSGEPWYRGQKYDDPDLQDRWNYIYGIEYIAMLLANDRLDKEYMPKPLLCRLYRGGVANDKLLSQNRLPKEFKFQNLSRMVSLGEETCKF